MRIKQYFLFKKKLHSIYLKGYFLVRCYFVTEVNFKVFTEEITTNLELPVPSSETYKEPSTIDFSANVTEDSNADDNSDKFYR